MTKTQKIQVLDHGYVSLVESWGSDERIIEAARMSTGKGFQGWAGNMRIVCKCGYSRLVVGCGGEVTICPQCNRDMTIERIEKGDEKLLRYLYTHKHLTPFEMCGATFEVQAPIFVFREWHRHRTQSYNEMSARYIPLTDMPFYLPSRERMLMGSESNKQAQGTGEKLSELSALNWMQNVCELYERIDYLYRNGLDQGVPKEIARVIIPVGRYSRMRASANLRNWLQFLALRMAASAQWEIRQYANAVGETLSQIFPRTWELFAEEFSNANAK